MSPSLSHCRGPASPSIAPLGYHPGLTAKCKEEGPAETLKLGQADKYGLTDFKETLKALDDSSEIHWLTDLLLLCLECQAFMSMGNQQGMRIKPNFHSYAESWNKLPKSPRIQIPRKRRRRAEGLVTLQHNLKMTPGTPRVPTKARRLTKFRITSSPTFEETQDSDEERVFICRRRRKRVVGKEREERSALKLEERKRSPQGSRRVKPSSVDFPTRFSKNNPFSHTEDLSVKRDCTLTDSDTDLSEYDNEMYTVCVSPTSFEPQRRTEDSDMKTPKAQITQATRQKHEEEKAEGVEETSSQRSFDEFGKRAAARRVMGKIEEVEGIIRRVSLSSLDWIKGGSEGGDEPQSISDGCDEVTLEALQQLQILQQRCQAEFSADPQLETENKGCNEDKPLLVEELRALGEALSQSLHQALRMEGERKDWKPSKVQSELFTGAKKSVLGSSRRPLNLPSYSQQYSTVSNNSSPPFLSAGAEISPLFTSSLSLTDQQEEEEDISDHHIDSWFSWGTGSGITLTGETENEESNARSETEASQDYLLSSGKNANNASVTDSIELLKVLFHDVEELVTFHFYCIL